MVDIDGAPGAGDMAAAGGVEFGALGEVEIDGVEDADGESVGLRIHGGGLALLGIGGELGGFRGGAFGGGIGMERGDLRGAGQCHGDVGGTFRGGAGGLAGGDLGSGGEDGGNGAEVRQRAGGEIAVIVSAAGGGENATGDAEVIDLMEVADIYGEAVDGFGKRAGGGCLGGEGGLDIAGFLEVAVEERGGLLEIASKRRARR